MSLVLSKHLINNVLTNLISLENGPRCNIYSPNLECLNQAIEGWWEDTTEVLGGATNGIPLERSIGQLCCRLCSEKFINVTQGQSSYPLIRAKHEFIYDYSNQFFAISVCHGIYLFCIEEISRVVEMYHWKRMQQTKPSKRKSAQNSNEHSIPTSLEFVSLRDLCRRYALQPSSANSIARDLGWRMNQLIVVPNNDDTFLLKQALEG